MHRLPSAALTALALTLLCAPAVAAAPADVSARECIAGGGVIVVSAQGPGAQTFTMHCSGGVHDGETVV
ncbi:hypothetical protein [Streptomyces sp. enrichment culture]|uniref:hypothetical protein n=1 Tax=Streptomyces sp. enrichment culture TaxID=1795815 RepID=UPI003F549246